MDEGVMVAKRFKALSWALDERMRRLYGAAEAQALGYGGISAVSEATGISRRALTEGIKELASRRRSQTRDAKGSTIAREVGGVVRADHTWRS